MYDFYKQLLINPKKLSVLGDGKQKKSYLNISDCIDAIFIGLEKSSKKVNIYNLGIEDCITVNQSIKYILSYLNLNPKIMYKGGKRGWIGDSPKILLDTKKIRGLGWKPKKQLKKVFLKLYIFLKKINGCLKNENSCYRFVAFRYYYFFVSFKDWT